MRNTTAAVVLLLLCVNLLSACSRPAPTPDALRTVVDHELTQSDSIWVRAMRPDTALSDLARLKQPPIYRVNLTYEPQNRELTGTADILFTNRADHPLNSLQLDTRALTASDAADEADRFALTNLQVNGKPATHTQEKDKVTLPLDKPLAAGATIHLTFSFRTVLPVVRRPTPEQEAALDSNWGQYGAIDNQTHGLSGAIPIVEDPGEPRMEYILWDVSITVPSEWDIISSGVSIAPATTEGDRKTTRIVSVSWSFSLFVAWGLQTATQNVDGVTVVVHYPGTMGSVGPEMLAETVQLLRTHEASLGPYPLSELDVLPLLLSVEGKSRSGLVLVNAQYMTDEPKWVPAKVTDPWLRRIMGINVGDWRRQVLAHELAHSWWGILLWPEMDSLRAPSWLEGLTEATGIAALERVYGPEAAEARSERQVYYYRLTRAAGITDMASGKVRPESASPQDYFIMSYFKPALFYTQVRRLVGDDAYFAAMRKYIERNRWSITTDPGPIEELLGNPQVDALYQRWLLETHGDADMGLLTPDQAKQLGLGQ